MIIFALLFSFVVIVVCREWSVREDSALAQQLQSQESEFRFISFYLLHILGFARYTVVSILDHI